MFQQRGHALDPLLRCRLGCEPPAKAVAHVKLSCFSSHACGRGLVTPL
jgi:hypothetical protein